MKFDVHSICIHLMKCGFGYSFDFIHLVTAPCLPLQYGQLKGVRFNKMYIERCTISEKKLNHISSAILSQSLFVGKMSTPFILILHQKKKIFDFIYLFFYLQLKTLSEQLSKLEQDRWQFYTSLGNAQRKLVDVQAETQKLQQSAEDVLSNLEKSRTEEAELLIELDKERYCFIYVPNLKPCISKQRQMSSMKNCSFITDLSFVGLICWYGLFLSLVPVPARGTTSLVLVSNSSQT